MFFGHMNKINHLSSSKPENNWKYLKQKLKLTDEKYHKNYYKDIALGEYPIWKLVDSRTWFLIGTSLPDQN